MNRLRTTTLIELCNHTSTLSRIYDMLHDQDPRKAYVEVSLFPLISLSSGSVQRHFDGSN